MAKMLGDRLREHHACCRWGSCSLTPRVNATERRKGIKMLRSKEKLFWKKETRAEN